MARAIRQYPKGRTEAFTDGVVAIVITLLVLDLGVRAGAEDDLLQAILDEWPSYLAYFVSFFTVGAFWLRHHAITDAIDHVDSAFIRLNLLAIFFLSFLPFPTRLLAEYFESEDAERVAVVFYGLALTLVSVAFNLLWRYASARRRLVASTTSDQELSELNDLLTPSIAGYAVAVLIGLALPPVAVVLYLAVAVLIALPLGTIRRGRRSA